MPLSSANADYHAILEVPLNASFDDIKRSYRRLALARHPDKHLNDANAKEAFQQLSEAYEVLSGIHARNVSDSVRQPNHDAAEFARQEAEDKRHAASQAWQLTLRERIRRARGIYDKLVQEIQYLESLDEEELEDDKYQEPFDDARLMQALEQNMTETVNEERDRFKDMYASSAPRHDPAEQRKVEEQWKERGRNIRKRMIRSKRDQVHGTMRDIQRLSFELETERRNDDERRTEEMKRRGTFNEE